ncbi:hypothetical protein [Serinicoccus sp. CUA-874]|nr:hypothetical protein [Serinicoccus sp. CUA-874]
MASNQSTRIRRAVARYAAGHDALRAATDAYVASSPGSWTTPASTTSR